MIYLHLRKYYLWNIKPTLSGNKIHLQNLILFKCVIIHTPDVWTYEKLYLTKTYIILFALEYTKINSGDWRCKHFLWYGQIK